MIKANIIGFRYYWNSGKVLSVHKGSFLKKREFCLFCVQVYQKPQ
jgi:hypothetical protein